jgi:hypothetical protein
MEDGMAYQNLWKDLPKMTCAISIAQTLERKERARVFSVSLARQNLARKLQVGVSTVEHLVRGRAKRIDAVIRDRLQALLVRELESEIVRLTHELEIARQGGTHLASDKISEIETHLAQARALLK